MNMIDLTRVAQAVVALVTALIGAVVVPWFKAKCGAVETAEFLRWVEIGVAAAEQLYATNDGNRKKDYVLKFLKDKGYTVDTESVETAVEAAVLQLHKELYYG